MSGLFQAVAGQLGNLGSGIASARDAGVEQKNKVAQALFEQQQRTAEFAEQQKMDTLQQQVSAANLKAAQAKAGGTWKEFGTPLRTGDGGLAVNKINDLTGEIRTERLPSDVTHENKVQDELDDLNKVYKKATGTDLPSDLQKEFIKNKLGEPKPSQSEVALGVEAFKRDHQGREPNLKEYTDIVRGLHPKGDGSEGGQDGLDSYAQAVASRAMPLTEVPSKVRGPLLSYMKKNGMQLPNQLPAGVQEDLQNRTVAMQRALDLIDSITPNLKYMQTIPGASLTYLAQKPDALEGFAAHAFGSMFSTKDQQNIDELSADLKSFAEALNIIRKPLGATVFRGKEGFSQLMGNTVSPLSRPGVNADVLRNTRATIQALFDKASNMLGGTDLEGGGVPGGAGADPNDPFGILPKGGKPN